MQSSYFARWDGHAVSVRGSRNASPSVYTVLIVSNDGTSQEQNWSAETVERLVLPVDQMAMAPRDVSDRPRTTKDAYSLTYRVQPAIKIDVPEGEEPSTSEDSSEPAPEPEWTNHGTTSPQALALALVAWVVGLGLRNMLFSGSPFNLETRTRHRVQEQRAMGSTGAPASGSTSRKTAPNRQTSRKNRRRRR